MKKYAEKIAYVLLVLLLAASLCACQNSGKNSDLAEEPENEICLYIVKDLKVEKSEANYQLKNPDSISASIEEVMGALVQAFAGELSYYSYMLDEAGNVDLEISMGCPVDDTESLAVQAAVAKTIFQLQEVQDIHLSVKAVEGELLSEQTYNRASFYYFDADSAGFDAVELVVYVPNSARDSLVESTVTVRRRANVSDQELVVEQLVELGYLPSKTKVNMVTVRGDVCYMDFSREFNGSVGGLSPEIELYGMVNSVLEQTDAKTLQILIDGEIEKTYRNSVDISQPLEVKN